MADLSQPRNPFANTPDDHLARLLVDDVEAPWYKSFIQNIKDLINPPKLPPLQVTSKPVPVKDIWGLYGRQKKSWGMSLLGQSLVVVLLFTVFSAKAIQQKMKEAVILFAPDIAPYQPKMAPKKDTMGGGGGGGDRSPLPASKGKLPKLALKQFTPPSATPPPAAKLTMDPSIIVPPDVPLPNVNMAQYRSEERRVGKECRSR